MKPMLKVIIIALTTMALSACGLIDTEQAKEVVELRKQILEIQINEVDPLVDQIKDLSILIDPLEEEIEDLEDEREKLYDEGRRLGNEFEDEMRNRFQDLFMQEDEARDNFADSI